MIACSYTPICVGVIGGWIGWLVFGLMWFVALVGTVVKIFAIGKNPRLSLAIYLIMGWSVLLIFPTVLERLSTLSMIFLVCEGLFYTSGTYFYAHDSRPHFHTIWHVFVLLGAISHWAVVLTILLS